MKATTIFAAAALILAASSSFAAETATAVSATAAGLNLPTIEVSKTQSRNRAEVKKEAEDFVKNHKTAFAVQLEQYKN